MVFLRERRTLSFAGDCCLGGFFSDPPLFFFFDDLLSSSSSSSSPPLYSYSLTLLSLYLSALHFPASLFPLFLRLSLSLSLSLRYEADKLKYYFALASFNSASAADVAYKEIDEMELEHSSCAIDVRAVPGEALAAISEGRECRDVAESIPADYEPPDFITKALQQTKVECTWEAGDSSRDKKFKAWGVGDNAWKAMEEGDDLNAYLASDCSSSDEDESGGEGEGEGRGQGGRGRSRKAKNMKSLLGLGGDDDDDTENDGGDAESEDDFFGAAPDEGGDDDDDDGGGGNMEYTIKPGANSLAAKLQKKKDAKDKGELSPWEKYQQKRKEKRKERKAKIRGKKNGGEDDEEDSDGGGNDGDGDEVPDWAKDDYDEDGGFFLEDGKKAEDEKGKGKEKGGKGKKGGKTGEEERRKKEEANQKQKRPSTKAELQAILGTDLAEEQIKDYDMRGLQRIDKNSKKNLKGARKKKEEKRAKEVSGKDFKVDTKDSRFSALLDGGDSRFGIDTTSSSFKETPAMREILEEQGKRREKKRKAGGDAVVGDVVARAGEAGAGGGGAAALAGLVSGFKRQAKKG